MTSSLDIAREALAAAQAARESAVADAARARDEFEQRPSTKTHNAMAIAEQIARNSVAPVDAARAEVERARRAELEERLAEARARAGHNRLLDATAPNRARLLELFDAVCAEVGAIETAVRTQHEAVRDAEDIARELGTHAAAPSKVAPTFIRAMIGLELAHRVYVSHARYVLGREPWTFIEPRWDRGSPAPDADEIRRARKVALPPDTFLPATPVDFRTDEADLAPWHEKPLQRPQRHEVT